MRISVVLLRYNEVNTAKFPFSQLSRLITNLNKTAEFHGGGHTHKKKRGKTISISRIQDDDETR